MTVSELLNTVSPRAVRAKLLPPRDGGGSSVGGERERARLLRDSAAAATEQPGGRQAEHRERRRLRHRRHAGQPAGRPRRGNGASPNMTPGNGAPCNWMRVVDHAVVRDVDHAVVVQVAVHVPVGAGELDPVVDRRRSRPRRSGRRGSCRRRRCTSRSSSRRSPSGPAKTPVSVGPTNSTRSAVATAIVVVFDSGPAFGPASSIDVVRPGWSQPPKLYARWTIALDAVVRADARVAGEDADRRVGDQLVVAQVDLAGAGDRDRPALSTRLLPPPLATSRVASATLTADVVVRLLWSRSVPPPLTVVAPV